MSDGATTGEGALKRTLGPGSLIALGIGILQHKRHHVATPSPVTA